MKGSKINTDAPEQPTQDLAPPQTSRPVGVVALILAALLAGGWCFWLATAQPAAAQAHAPHGPRTPTEAERRANPLFQVDPQTRALDHNPLGLPSPVSDVEPYRFARVHGGVVEEVAMFMLPDAQADAAAARWTKRLEQQGWQRQPDRTAVSGATARRSLAFTRKRDLTNAPPAVAPTVQVQLQPRTQGYHQLLLVYRHAEAPADKP